MTNSYVYSHFQFRSSLRLQVLRDIVMIEGIQLYSPVRMM
jgi:hypothetical protein